MFNFRSAKTQLIIFLTSFAVFLSIVDRDIAFLIMAISAVIFCITIESAIIYIKTKVFQVTESSVISGLIIGYVLSSDEPWWKFLLAASLAILSKNIIRYQKRHVFNPAAFGIFLTLILSGASTQWKGTYVWYILIPIGLYFIHKVRRIEIVMSYAIVSFVLFGAQALFQKIALWHIFGYFSYFFIFIMMIEPMTTPMKLIGKLIFGASVAVVIFILTERGARLDVELLSLLVANALVPILNKLLYNKGETV